jgi:hypothetical protein
MRINRMLGMSAVAVVLTAAGAQAPAAASGDIPAAGQWAYFQNYVTSKVIAVNAGQTQNGAKIIQYQPIARPNTYPIDDQTWLLIKSGAYFYLENRKTSKVLAIPNGNPNNGAGAIQWSLDTTVTDQQWKLEIADYPHAGYYTLRNRKTDKCLGVPNGNTADGIQLIQWTCGDQYNDQFWWFDAFDPLQ